MAQTPPASVLGLIADKRAISPPPSSNRQLWHSSRRPRRNSPTSRANHPAKSLPFHASRRLKFPSRKHKPQSAFHASRRLKFPSRNIKPPPAFHASRRLKSPSRKHKSPSSNNKPQPAFLHKTEKLSKSRSKKSTSTPLSCSSTMPETSSTPSFRNMATSTSFTTPNFTSMPSEHPILSRRPNSTI